VLTEEDYNIVMDSQHPLEKRLAAFARRASWNRPLGLKQDYPTQINHMIDCFGEMGVVERRQGTADPYFPPSLEVQDLPKHTQQRLVAEGPVHDADETDLTGIEKVRRFPHGLKK
jgi:hypothetical protein